MIINSDSKWAGGMGDLICFSWLAACADTNRPRIHFYTRDPRKRVLLDVLGQVYSDDWKHAIDMSPAYEAEMKDLCRLPRWIYWTQHLKRTELVPVCPTVTIHPGDLQWVTENILKKSLLQRLVSSVTRAADRKLVLLFPNTSQYTRSWLTSHWMNLAEMLYASGCFPLAIFAGSELDGLFRYSIKDAPLGRIAAMMRLCSLTITCDSFPAHLAATVGCPTLTIWGPTTPENVFGHCLDRIEILRVSPEVCECVGCNSDKKLIRPACSVACEALVMLQPKVVLERVLEMVK